MTEYIIVNLEVSDYMVYVIWRLIKFFRLKKKVFENTRVTITDKMLSQTLKQLINLDIIAKISVENKKRYKISIIWIKLKPVMYELEKFWENLIKQENY